MQIEVTDEMVAAYHKAHTIAFENGGNRVKAGLEAVLGMVPLAGPITFVTNVTESQSAYELQLLQEMYGDLHREFMLRQERASDLRDRYGRLQSEAQCILDQRNAADKANSRLVDRCTELQRQLDNLQDRFEQMTRYRDNCYEDARRLEVQLAEVQAQLNDATGVRPEQLPATELSDIMASIKRTVGDLAKVRLSHGVPVRIEASLDGPAWTEIGSVEGGGRVFARPCEREQS